MTPSENFLVDLAVLCDKHGASLFFGDASASLWINGEDCGHLRDSEGSVGDRFEVVADGPHAAMRQS